MLSGVGWCLLLDLNVLPEFLEFVVGEVVSVSVLLAEFFDLGVGPEVHCWSWEGCFGFQAEMYFSPSGLISIIILACVLFCVSSCLRCSRSRYSIAFWSSLRKIDPPMIWKSELSGADLCCIFLLINNC